MSLTPSSLFHSLVPLALAGLTLAGCGGSDPIGGLKVPFVLGASQECTSIGVEQVKITATLVDDDDGAGMTFDETGPCGAGEVTLDNLPVGTYSIVAEGLDPNGLTILDNLGPGGKVQAEVLEAQTNTSESVTLRPAPAVLRLRWSLAVDGFQAMCQDVSVAKFTVEAYKGDGLNLLTSHTFGCEDPADSEGQYRTLPDLERALSGDEVALIHIIPKDANNTALGDASQVCLTEPPGYGQLIEITVECDNDVCAAYESAVGPGDSCA